MAWKINRPLDWLTRALKLRAGEAPSQLDDQQVSSTLDVYQGGHSVVSWETEAETRVIAAATELLIVCDKDSAVSRLVRLSFTRSGAGGTMDVRIVSSIDNATANATRLYEELAIAAGTQFRTWGQIGLGRDFWYVPPGFSLVIRVAGVVGDTIEYRAQVGTFPAGSKPF